MDVTAQAVAVGNIFSPQRLLKGFATDHMRAALQGPSLTVPFQDGGLLLGTWQQVILAEFDIRPRQRNIVVQIIGE